MHDLTGTAGDFTILNGNTGIMEGSNERLNLAFKFVEYTGRHVFLTGKAGTGKTTFLRSLRKVSRKRMVVVAPTGVAAINAGGMTIHSFFQMPFGPIVPDNKPLHTAGKSKENFFSNRLNREKINIIRSLDLLVIDEISMVRADLLDGIDKVLRQYRRNSDPFGGVQLLMIGDLQQLAPVVKEAEWEVIRSYYSSAFFFSSLALQKSEYVTIVLEHVYRQSDQKFIELLNRVRLNRPDEESLRQLNQRYDPEFINSDPEGYIILTTHNNKARSINQERLNSLPEKEQVFTALVEGDFPEQSWPTDYELMLKKGSQVMFIKNDLSEEKRYFNGKIGRVEDIEDNEIWVRCEGEEEAFLVEKSRWENIKYRLDSKKELKEEITGTFTQYPLKLAWAITIHKSQGLTFDKAIIDARTSFSHGQVYVALSRCRSLEGMVLNSPVESASIINNESVAGFTEKAENNPPGTDDLIRSQLKFEKGLIREVFSYARIRQNMDRLKSILNSHEERLPGDPVTELQNLYERTDKEIFRFEKPFLNQLDQLYADLKPSAEHPQLKKRIAEAAKYHYEKLEGIVVSGLDAVEIHSDNSEIRKKTNQVLNELNQEVYVKLRCLDCCRKGFELSDFLDVRAKAMSVTPGKKSGKTQNRKIMKGSPNSVLFRTLINWRNLEAEEKDLPVYMIMPVKTIENLAWFAPHDQKELGKVKGIGAKKLDEYGEVLLDIIRSSGAEPMAPLPVKEAKKSRSRKKKRS